MAIEINHKITSWSVSSDEAPATPVAPVEPAKAARPLKVPPVVSGRTHTLYDPSGHATYVTINHMPVDGATHPIQMFVNSKDPEKALPAQLMGRLASAIFRQGHDVAFVAEELQAVTDARSGFRQGKRWYPSWVAQVGETLGQEMDYYKFLDLGEPVVDQPIEAIAEPTLQGPVCPKCGSTNTKLDGGCFECLDCGASKCD